MLNQEEARQIIKKLKNEYGFTYNYIAELIGVSANHLYHFVIGDRNLKRDRIFKLETLINGKIGDVKNNV